MPFAPLASTIRHTDLEADARARVAACSSLADLEALKVELFGKKGAITAQLKSLGASAIYGGTSAIRARLT